MAAKGAMLHKTLQTAILDNQQTSRFPYTVIQLSILLFLILTDSFRNRLMIGSDSFSNAMNCKTLISALVITLTVQQNATAQANITAPANSGSESISAQSRSDRSSSRQRAVTRQRAASVALSHVRRIEGPNNSRGIRVTWIGREDDYGAWWEVEVTVPRRRIEYDVYVNRSGRVVRVVRNRDRMAARSHLESQGPAANLVRVRATAVEHVQQLTGQTNARVTGFEREDDYGAQWEVEVTLPNGVEYNVYMTRDGRIIRAVVNGSGQTSSTGLSQGLRPTGRDQAAATAVAHIQQATGQSKAQAADTQYENRHGAWWRVTVTLPSGVGYEVYVAQNGQVVRSEASSHTAPSPSSANGGGSPVVD